RAGRSRWPAASRRARGDAAGAGPRTSGSPAVVVSPGLAGFDLARGSVGGPGGAFDELAQLVQVERALQAVVAGISVDQRVAGVDGHRAGVVRGWGGRDHQPAVSVR